MILLKNVNIDTNHTPQDKVNHKHSEHFLDKQRDVLQLHNELQNIIENVNQQVGNF